MPDLVTLAKSKYNNDVTKTSDYYEIYEKYFGVLKDMELRIAEIGVYDGVSMKVFSEYFSQSKLLGVDLERKPIDFSRHENVDYRICDQADSTGLRLLVDEFAPHGLDIVIDDASHYGFYSLITFLALFPRLKLGGLYTVEDWGTGYWDDWPDGSRFQAHKVQVAHCGEFGTARSRR